jgi:hypothetical protein
MPHVTDAALTTLRCAAEAATFLRSGRVASSCHSISSTATCHQLAPPVHDLIRHARAALDSDLFAAVEPETLCCLALALSGGQEKLETQCPDVDELRVGLCQVCCMPGVGAGRRLCARGQWPHLILRQVKRCCNCTDLTAPW